MVRGVMLLVAVPALAAVLVGCSNASAMTCSEYAAKSFEEKGNVLDDLLAEKGLETVDIGNGVGVMQAVDTYCGTNGFSAEATQNQSEPIENAQDWDAETWGD